MPCCVPASRPRPRPWRPSWLKTHPRDVLFLFHLGDEALTRKDYASAETRYRAVLAASPAHALALNNVAWLLLQQKKPGALPLAEQAVKAAPDRPALRDTLAQALAAEGRLPQALEMQKSALALRPDDPHLRLNLARLYAQVQREEAGPHRTGPAGAAGRPLRPPGRGVRGERAGRPLSLGGRCQRHARPT